MLWLLINHFRETIKHFSSIFKFLIVYSSLCVVIILGGTRDLRSRPQVGHLSRTNITNRTVRYVVTRARQMLRWGEQTWTTPRIATTFSLSHIGARSSVVLENIQSRVFIQENYRFLCPVANVTLSKYFPYSYHVTSEIPRNSWKWNYILCVI